MRARPLFVVALGAALVVLGASTSFVTEPLPPLAPSPSPSSPSPPPHFALDDLDLGPSIRLTRFYPDFDIYRGAAVEGADGRLYIEYFPNRPPPQWSLEGGEASRLGVFEGGRIQPVRLEPGEDKLSMDSGRISIIGLSRGVPIVQAHDVGVDRFFALRSSGPTPIRKPATIERMTWPCRGFDAGQICQASEGNWEVIEFRPRERRPFRLAASIYPVANESGGLERGELWLEGAGPDYFFVTENHPGQNAAECLIGEVVEHD